MQGIDHFLMCASLTKTTGSEKTNSAALRILLAGITQEIAGTRRMRGIGCMGGVATPLTPYR